jgi:hypothetical protein
MGLFFGVPGTGDANRMSNAMPFPGSENWEYPTMQIGIDLQLKTCPLSVAFSLALALPFWKGTFSKWYGQGREMAYSSILR